MRREHVAVKTPNGALNMTHGSHVYRHALLNYPIYAVNLQNKKAFSVKNNA